MRNLSPRAIRAFFNPDCDENVITLLKIEQEGLPDILLADGYNQRLSETDEDIIYGVKSGGKDYLFLPMSVTLPNESSESAAVAKIEIQNATRELIAAVRSFTAPPKLSLSVVLASTPDVIECHMPDFLLSSLTFDKDSISGSLVLDNMTQEPFPCYNFTPSYFKGLF